MTPRCLLLLLVLISPAAAEEPRELAGRPTADWIKDLTDKQSLVREEALEVLASGKIKSALPTIAKMLDDPHPAVRQRAALALWKIDGRREPATAALTSVLNNPDAGTQHRRDALNQIRELNLPDDEFVPLLLALLNDPDQTMQYQARSLLRLKSDKALPVLLAKLPKATTEQRLGIVAFLGGLGATSGRDQAIAALKNLIETSDDRIRVECARALLQMGRVEDVAYAALTRAAKGDDAVARQAAVQLVIHRRPRVKEFEPFYRAALKERDSIIRAAGIEALYEIDPNSIKETLPILRELVQEGSQTGRPTAISLIQRLGPAAKPILPDLVTIIESEGSTANYEIHQLMMVLGRMGPEAAPHLVKLFKHSNSSIRANAGQAVGLIGPPALPVLEPLLKDDNVDVRRAAYQAVALISRDNAQATKLIVAGLNDRDSNIRTYSLTVLGQARGLDKSAIGPLRDALRSEALGDYYRSLAAQALGNIGPEAREVVPDLKKLVDVLGMPQLRLRSAEALWRITGDGKEAKVALLEHLKSDRATFSIQPGNPLEILVELGVEPKELIPLLKRWAESGPGLRHSAVSVMRYYFPKAPEALPLLKEYLKDSDLNVRREAAMSLVAYGDEAADAVPILAQQVRAIPDQQMLAALMELGPAAKAALPVLKELWSRPTAVLVRMRLAAAIVAIDPKDSKEYRDLLIMQLNDRSMPSYRVEAAVALARVDPKHPDLVPALLEIAKFPTRNITGPALDVLGQIKAPAAVPIFRKYLTENDVFLRQKAAEGLWRVQGKAAEVVPVLTALLAERLNTGTVVSGRMVISRYSVAQDSARLLGEIGPDAAEALPALNKCLNEPDMLFRRTVADAIKRIEKK